MAPILFGIEKLNFLLRKLRRLSAILWIDTSHKLIFVKPLKALRIMNFETSGSELSATYAA